MIEPPEIEPDYSPEQREELGRIDYFLRELRSLRDRGMIPPEAYDAANAEKAPRRAEIERIGTASGAVKTARALKEHDPHRALTLADRARELDPTREDAWALSVDLLAGLGEFDRAIAVCREASDGPGHHALLDRIARLESRRDRQARAARLAEFVAIAREAIEAGDAETALAASREALGLEPKHNEALTTAIRSLIALGRFDEADAACGVLRKVNFSLAATWTERVRSQRRVEELRSQPPIKANAAREVVFLGGEESAVAPNLSAAPSAALAIPTGPRWPEIAAEFLEEHWQKLILSLAVLLIVVASTLGSALVLGDRLWMAEGKCLLATAYTILFAGFGHGLARWGAERAGRIMKLTTLIVLPVSFALVGELPTLGRSSATSLLVLAVDSAAMMALVWFVCRSLGISGGKATPVALIALGLLNALTPQGSAFWWGFTAMLAASFVFASSGEWLGAWLAARPSDESSAEDAPYFAFGLLAFYYACAVGRIGGYVLHLHPTLYALAAMLSAAAALRVADGLRASGHADRSVALLQAGGYALSALAFALGLSRPPDHSPLYSGNTLAAALVGLYLYGRALWMERRAAFLYAGFAALFLAYFGTHEFIKDVFSPVEGRIGRALGYPGKLPFPFRALNALVFNAFLAALSLVFARRWKDENLARHCHRIGLPLSIAACLLSGLEPLAAVFTLTGYTLAYAVATWLFGVPALAYLSCAAFAGAAVAASTFLGDRTIGTRSLALSAVGLVLWGTCRVLGRERAPAAYRAPVVRSSRIVVVVALGFAAVAAWAWDPPSWSAASALWALAVLYVLIGLESPRESLAYAALGCASMAALITVRLVAIRIGRPIDSTWFAVCPALLSLMYQANVPWLATTSEHREIRLGRASLASSYPTPLFHLGLILAALAVWLVGTHLAETIATSTMRDLTASATVLTLVAGGLVIASAWSSNERVAYPAILAATAGAIAWALAATLANGRRPSLAIAGLSCAGASLVLVTLGDRLRHRHKGRLAIFRNPLISTTFLAVGLAWILGGWAWPDSYFLTTALVLTAITLTVAARQVPYRPVPDLALLSGLAAWLAGNGALASRTFDALPGDGVLIGAYLVAVLVAAEFLRFAFRHAEQSSAGRAFASAVPEFAGVASIAALAMGGAGLRSANYPALTVVLGLSACVFLWLPRFRREFGLIHAGLILACLASASGTRWAVGSMEPGLLPGWLALTTAIDGLILCGLRWAGRRRGLGTFVLDPIRDLGVGLAAVTFVLAMAASAQTLDSYAMAFSALVILIVALVASATMERTSWRTYAAIVAGVAAAYLTLFELGRGRTGHVSSLGVLASLLAIALWGIERLASWRARGEWRDVFVHPLRHAMIATSLLAIPSEWDAPRALLLASLPFLLIVKSLPSAGWVYPALALMGASGAFSAFDRWGEPSLIPLAVVAAFACWTLGLALWRWRPATCRRLGLPETLGLEFPFYHASMALGLIAIGLRLHAIDEHHSPWSSSPWVPAALAVLALLMLKPYPMRGWVDLFIGFMSLSIFATVAPSPSAPMAWVLVGMSLALLWRMAEWGAVPTQSAVCSRLGIGFDRISEPLREWSLGLLAVATLPLSIRVAASVLSATLGVANSFPTIAPGEWSAGLVAILLFGANLDLTARSVPGPWSRVAPRIAITLAIWWLAIPASPLMARLGLDPAAVIPIATAAQGVIAAALGNRARDRWVLTYGFGLSLAAVALTGASPTSATAITLFLATAASSLYAMTERNRPAAGVASMLWCAAMMFASWQIARRFGWARWPSVATVEALAVCLAAAGLIVIAGRDRRRGIGLAAVVEGVSLAAVAISAALVGAASFADLGPMQAMLDVGVMFAIGSLCVVLASRWESLPLAFAAQASILLGYGAFRSGFAASPAWDSAAMLLLAGTDLGVAEIAGRGRRLFALPALATGLFLPMLAVGLSLRNGWIGDVPMFALFASGTFYAATCLRTRWKTLGYAAAVLYNAALWVLWSRFGWEMIHDPQFFFVPVGFSTILFAEANREELGRPQVNAIRGIGLSLMYLALAVPIWQTASLLAWACVLLVSLLGIFAGIGLRSQAFLWLGLGGFVLDVVYQLGRIGHEHALAKWGIMLALGIALVLFVALNEKKRLVETLRKYVDVVRQWE